VSRKTLLVTIGVCFISLLTWAQPELPASAKLEMKAFEAGLSFAQGLAQWALLVVAGSIVILVGTSYYRPRVCWFRMMYLLFLPGWIFLARSLYDGVSVQRVYLAYLFTNATEERLKQLKVAMTEDSFNESGISRSH
jgi:hypothetical protein